MEEKQRGRLDMLDVGAKSVCLVRCSSHSIVRRGGVHDDAGLEWSGHKPRSIVVAGIDAAFLDCPYKRGATRSRAERLTAKTTRRAVVRALASKQIRFSGDFEDVL